MTLWNNLILCISLGCTGEKGGCSAWTGHVAASRWCPKLEEQLATVKMQHSILANNCSPFSSTVQPHGEGTTCFIQLFFVLATLSTEFNFFWRFGIWKKTALRIRWFAWLLIALIQRSTYTPSGKSPGMGLGLLVIPSIFKGQGVRG